MTDQIPVPDDDPEDDDTSLEPDTDDDLPLVVTDEANE